jgi:hypothetical protein
MERDTRLGELQASMDDPFCPCNGQGEALAHYRLTGLRNTLATVAEDLGAADKFTLEFSIAHPSRLCIDDKARLEADGFPATYRVLCRPRHGWRVMLATADFRLASQVVICYVRARSSGCATLALALGIDD